MRCPNTLFILLLSIIPLLQGTCLAQDIPLPSQSY
jgi:hypothetical protein